MIDQKICFIIPAFNEQNTISEVIHKIQDYGDIIVVDDCSTDKTKEILSKLKVINVRHHNNLGYDLSLNTGFKKAYELNMNFAITIDADGQHDIKDAKKIIDLLHIGNSIVTGRRKYLPRFTEKMFSFYTKIFYNISDPLCGLKGYNLKDCKDFDILNPNNQIGTKILLNCKRKNLKIEEFEIKQINRVDSSRYGGSLKANIKIFKILFLLILKDLLRLFKII